MKTDGKQNLISLVLCRGAARIPAGIFKSALPFLLLIAVVFWGLPAYGEIFVYEKNGAFFLTDTYQGSNFIKRYKTKKPEVKKTLELSNSKNRKFSKEIFKASKKYGVNSNLIKAVIATESGFKPDAVSPKGAMGLMQLMPDTAKRFNVTDPFDPDQNIEGGTQYMKFLLSKFKGDRRLVLAAYNAGENNVLKYGTVPPFKETTAYVRKVLKYFNSLEKTSKKTKTSAKTRTIKKKSTIHKYISPSGTILFSDNAQIKFTQ